jgi:lysophospholipase L1-like esterase
VAAATADRLKTLVGLERPDLVLWQVGTNDALMRVGIDDFRATVVDTLRWLKEHEIDTVLVGLQYTLKVAKDEHYRAIRMALRDIAQSEGVLLVRRYEAMEFIEKAKAGPLLAGDELHLNDLGYRCMAEHIARAMVVSAFFKGTGTPRVGRTLP